MDLYGHLLEIGGGKERMTKYFKVKAEQHAMRMWVLRLRAKVGPFTAVIDRTWRTKTRSSLSR